MLVTSDHQSRAHLLSPQEWGYAAGTDFYLFGSINGMLTAGNGHELSDYGWTTTALALAAGSLADFITSADVGTPGQITFDAASDLLQSPAIFGDYAHARLAQEILGVLPNTLRLKFYAAFTTAANNETATAIGFVEAGGSPIGAADAMAMICSDGTNFGLRSGATTDAGAAVDTAFHLWEIVITGGGTTIEWFQDGTSQGTITLQADLWPASFGAGIVAAGLNRLALSWAHIRYE